MGQSRHASAGADASAVGTELELEVTNVAHGGVFVARHEGRVVFVSDAIPGERVRARIADTGHSRFWRAATVPGLEERKSVVSGKRVDLGGRPLL